MAGVRRIYGATGLTGGLTGSLDSIGSGNLVFGDLAIAQGNTGGYSGHVAETDDIYFYRYANVSTAEDSPKIIKPDDVDVLDPGRWLLISPAYFMEDLTIEAGQKIVTNEIQGNDADLTIGYYKGVPTEIGAVTDNSNGTLVNGTYTNGGAGYPTTTSGSGTGLTVDVVVSTSNITFTINTAGDDYAIGDTVVVAEHLDFSDLATGTLDATVKDNVGTVHITLGATGLTFDAPALFTEQVSSSVIGDKDAPSGDAPFIVVSDIMVSKLNVQYLNGVESTDISLLDGSQSYTNIPSVVNATVQVPVADKDLTTKKYVDDLLTAGSSIDHGTLDGLLAGEVTGSLTLVTPGTGYATSPQTGLATTGGTGTGLTVDITTDGDEVLTVTINDGGNGYAAGQTITITGGDGAGATFDTITVSQNDDHLIYTKADGTRAFTGTVSGVTPTLSAHLSTKGYVDTVGAQLLADNVVLRDGTKTFTAEVSGITPDGLTSSHLTTVQYVENGFDTLDHTRIDNRHTGDQHNQYPLASATGTQFTGKIRGISTGGGDPADTLTTKDYVDAVSTASADAYIRRDGSNTFITKMPVVDITPTTFLIQAFPVNDGYVDELNVPTSGGSGDGSLTFDITTYGGEVVTVVLNNRGIGYQVDDILTIEQSGWAGTEQAVVEIQDGTPFLTNSEPYELATVEYVDGILGASDHGLLNAASLLDDDHTQYMTTNPASSSPVRSFSTTVEGVYPTIDTHLSTKKYVDDTVVTSHSSLSDLGLDTHTQYAILTGVRNFSQPIGYDNGTIVSAAGVDDFVTKQYVDDEVSAIGFSATNLVDVFGTNPIISNQSYTNQFLQDPFVDSSLYELANVEFIGSYTSRFVVSETDGFYDFFTDKVEPADVATGLTNINDGSVTGVIVAYTSAELDGIGRAEITDGGSGFFVFDYADVGYPATYNGTGTEVFNAAGTGSQSITETQIFPDSDTGTDADIAISNVVGDIEYMEIVNAGVGLTGGDGDYPFVIAGTGSTKATWLATVSGGTIVSVERDTTATNGGVGVGYSSNLISSVTAISGITGTFELQPYVLGEIANIEIVTEGTGYDSASYNLIDGTEGLFTITGEGSSGGLITGNSLDVTFYNPTNEKLKWRHYNPTITGTADASWTDYTPAGGVGYTRQTGNVISEIQFDEFGHIVDISEEGMGGAAWVEVKDTDDLLVLTANTNYFALTDTSAYELRLPAAPPQGTTIIIDDYFANSSVNNITVADSTGGILRVNGSVASHTIIDVDDSRCIFTYVGTDASANNIGWRLKVY